MKTDQISRIEAIAALFDIDGKVSEVKPWGNGLINDTFRVTADAGKQYILQRINTAIFKDPALLQHNLKLITAHIRKSLEREGAGDIDRKVLTSVDTTDGRDYAEVDGEAWRMTVFISGSHTEESVTPATARLTGEAFARFHTYFASPDAPELQETIPDFHNVGFRISQLRDAAAADPAGRLEEARDCVDTLLGRADEMLEAERLNKEGQLPKRIAHCDTKVNNILFGENGEILCVIDLDTTMPGYILSDFGDFIRTAGNTGDEDDRDLDRVGVDMDIFRSFAEGYLANAAFLTPVERQMLPFGAKMLTYMQAVRFLTDYLNGDTYYKIQYPEHNLVRTRAQMKLLSDIDAHFPEMQQFVASI